MSAKLRRKFFGNTIFNISFVLIVLLSGATAGFGQTIGGDANASAKASVIEAPGQANSPTVVVQPFLKNYKDVTLGMTDKEVRDKLGKPVTGDDQSVYYQFNDGESAQFTLDQDKKVQIISMMYFNKKGAAPEVKDVFGAETEVSPNADGSIYKLVRYPEAGYVVIYSRTAGENPTVVVTMQKI